jgi:hypothetical protein
VDILHYVFEREKCFSLTWLRPAGIALAAPVFAYVLQDAALYIASLECIMNDHILYQSEFVRYILHFRRRQQPLEVRTRSLFRSSHVMTCLHDASCSADLFSGF